MLTRSEKTYAVILIVLIISLVVLYSMMPLPAGFD